MGKSDMKTLSALLFFLIVLYSSITIKAYGNLNGTIDVAAGVGDTVVYFLEDFEAAGFSSRGWYDNTKFVTDNTVAYNGMHSAKFHWGQGAILPDTGGTMRKKFTETGSLYISYRVKYSSGYTGSNKPYHPHEFYILTNADDDYLGPAATHLTAYIEQNEGHPMIAINDALNIDVSKIGNDLTFVTEQRAIAGGNGNGNDGYTGIEFYQSGSSYRNGKAWKDLSTTISNDVWHHVEVHLKLNSISSGKGIGDGILQYWLDGVKLIDKNGVMFRTGQHPNMKFDQFLIGPYIGDGSPVDQAFWIDDLLVGEIIAGAPVTNTLIVNSGTGDGSYTTGAMINISADAPPAGKVFDQWTGDVGSLLNVYSAYTTVTMPAGDVEITASYIDDVAAQNLALNKPTTASDPGATQYQKAYAVDDNTNTIWSVSGYPQWLEVDLGDIYTVTSTELVCYLGRAYQFTVDVKTTPDAGYVQLVDRSSNTTQGTSSTPIKDNFSASKARYVRITVTGASGYAGSIISLTEFRVFGTSTTDIARAINADGKITVSPNPVNTTMIISGQPGWDGKANVSIYSLHGTKIYKSPEKVSFPYKVDISSFLPGIYIVGIATLEGKLYKQKIVKE